ncbi:MAG: zinc-ribbon domain-containing protein [Gemmataceae bacterium]|nr:zinc-ribbon domain-containing protein [Gemmataceae bacterium]
MPIRVACPDCSAVLSAPDAAAGTVVTCPKCRAPLELPSAAELARRRRPDEDDRPRRRPAREGDEEDDRPRRPRPRRNAAGGGLPVWAGVLVGVLAVGAAGAGVYFLTRGKADLAGGGLFGGGAPASGGVKYVPRESEKKYLALSKEKGDAPITAAEVLATLGEPTRKDPPVTGRDRKTGVVFTVEAWYWEVPGSGISSQMGTVNGFASGQVIGLEVTPRGSNRPPDDD